MRTLYLTVTAMNGEGCIRDLTKMLCAVPGIGNVTVSSSERELTIHFNERCVSAGQLTAAVEEAGYGIDAAGPLHTRPAARRPTHMERD